MQKKTTNQLNNQQIQKNQIITQMMSVERRSILPPPSELKEYENLYPGITKILLDSYQKQSNHRMTLENKVIDSGINNSKRGQVFAFIISMVTIGIGGTLLFLGKNITGLSAILGALGTLLGVFIYGNKSKKDERLQKSKNNPE